MASALPPELLQSILLLTSPETETYHSARQTCRTWRNAASNAFMLRKTLAQTPAAQLPPLNSMTVTDWNVLFDQVARLNLIGLRRHISKRSSRRTFPDGCSPSAVSELSSDGSKMVILKGSRVMVYDMKSDQGRMQFEFSLAQSLYPLWTTMCRAFAAGIGGMACCALSQGYARHHLALSTTGHLVAVALGKTIQIYDLTGGKDGTDLYAQYVLDEGDPPPLPLQGRTTTYAPATGVVESLEFSESDTLLRVAIGKESSVHRSTRVRYLGNPSKVVVMSTPGIDYWKQTINHTYLDSTALAVSFKDEAKTAIKGLRLLPRSFRDAASSSSSPQESEEDPGRHFLSVLQTNDPPSNSYCLGFISSVDGKMRIRRRFPTRSDTDVPSQLNPDETSTSTNPKDFVSRTRQLAHSDRWHPVNLPCVSTQPTLAASDDCKVFVVHEAGAGHAYSFAAGGALYVYSLESCVGVGVESEVRPWSFLLDIVDVDVESLRVSKSRLGYTVTAVSKNQVLEWDLFA